MVYIDIYPVYTCAQRAFLISLFPAVSRRVTAVRCIRLRSLPGRTGPRAAAARPDPISMLIAPPRECAPDAVGSDSGPPCAPPPRRCSLYVRNVTYSLFRAYIYIYIQPITCAR